jgi:CheY-like chemotaxis protein
MNGLSEFGETLRGALTHLHDPNFQSAAILYDVLQCDPAGGSGPVQSKIVTEIEAMKPDPDLPLDSRLWREFDALHKRYVLGLTQEETAEHLHMSVRNVQRIQAEATHVLARRIWDGRLGPQPGTEPGTQAPDWRSQADVELASLRESAPNVTADVAETLRGVLDLGGIVASKHGVRLETKFVQPDLVAGIHPSALRQTLISTLGRLAQCMSSGQLSIYATLEDGQVKITMTGLLAEALMPTDDDLIRDVITPPGTSLEIRRKGRRAFVRVKLPSVGERIVLVVEDNPDMVHFYRRSTAGTPYRIVLAAPGQDVARAIEAAAPDVVVLDVMLPEVDGWQLLTHLHERPATRSIPVIVCSVVREEELALSLGASCFLSKPVQARQFVEALDRVLLRASAEPPRARASNGAAC